MYQPLGEKITEESVVNEIIQYLAYQGIVLNRIVERIPTRDGWGRIRGRTSTPGMPDLVGYISARTFEKWNKATEKRRQDELKYGGPGILQPFEFFPTVAQPVYIEVKRPGGKKRIRQELFIAALKADGVTAFFADSIVAAVKGMQMFGYPVRLPGE